MGSAARKVRHYRDLIVWQKAMDLVENTYAVTRALPADERFGLVQQMQRAAVSVPSNIAEGHQRQSRNAYMHFLSIARGSLAELETQLLMLPRLQYMTEADIRMCLKLADEVGRMLRAITLRLAHPAPSP